MRALQARLPFLRRLLALASVAILTTAACAPPAAAPTAAPAKPAPTAAPARLASPVAKPAATLAPAAKPTEQPTARPAAKPAPFDEKAVADFYRSKTLRIVVGYGPGGQTDVNVRMIQKVLSRYIPGSPTIVVENKPGGGSMLAANTLYASEAKDGTVIGAIGQGLPLQQALGVKGVQYDAAKLNWLASTYASPVACAVRTDSGVTSIQDMADGGKELVLGSWGKGTPSFDPPAVMNAVLGTRFKIVTGYEGGAAARLAVQSKEVQGFCTSFDSFPSVYRDMFEGASPLARVLVVTGAETPQHPFLKGVPAAERLAKTEEAKALLRAVHASSEIYLPYAAAPEVSRDRVQALRRAFDKAFIDPEYIAAAEKTQQTVGPKTGEEVARIVQAVLDTPAATLAKLAQILE